MLGHSVCLKGLMRYYSPSGGSDPARQPLVPLWKAEISFFYYNMVKKCYTVVFQSTIPAAATTQIETFFYDWSQIEEGQYSASFAFMSGVNLASAPTNTNPVNVYADLGQGAYTQVASSLNTATAGQVYSPSYIGTLEIGYLAVAANSYSFYFARPNTNAPIYLEQRPRNNNVTITLYTNSQSQVATPPQLPGPYTLTLSLQQL